MKNITKNKTKSKTKNKFCEATKVGDLVFLKIRGIDGHSVILCLNEITLMYLIDEERNYKIKVFLKNDSNAMIIPIGKRWSKLNQIFETIKEIGDFSFSPHVRPFIDPEGLIP